MYLYNLLRHIQLGGDLRCVLPRIWNITLKYVTACSYTFNSFKEFSTSTFLIVQSRAMSGRIVVKEEVYIVIDA